MAELHDSIQYLKGVGAKRAALYGKLGVDTIYSLLRFFPRTYVDYTEIKPIAECPVGEVCCIKAKVYRKQGEQRIRKGLSLFRVYVTDGTSDLIITIFNSKYLYEALQLDQTYCFRGKMQGNLLRREMNSPEYIDPNRDSMVKAVYPLTEGLSNKVVSSNVKQAFTLWGDQLFDVIPDYIKQEEELCHLRFAYESIHFPPNQNALAVAKKRLVFEELLTLQLGLSLLKQQNREQTGITITKTSLTVFYQALPFTLTGGQMQAVQDGLADFQKDVPMNRLVQGDVGSGKTMVACALAYVMAQNGYQSAVMAPTEILAVQHYHTFSEILSPMGIRCGLLTGSLTAKQKNLLKQEIADGAYDVVIGTHALIQDTVSFPNLGFVVTDEQHRFGVNQRAKLAQKGNHPHKLVMSATPIPRTLALIIYGDLDISVISESPKGRLPVKTYLINGKKRLRAYHFIKQNIDEGRQAYIVCPLIEEGEADSDLVSVQEYEAKVRKTELGQVRTGILHGKMKQAEKDAVMADFKERRLDLLICTTVVEVGVDVPNAVIMMIENAEQFGLSQLHQLRGRVGRGSVQSHCILVSDNQNTQTRERLHIMTESSDGFYISEQDLKQRGPGDFFGSRQHGLPQLKIANMVDDMETLKNTQRWATQILTDDPMLAGQEHEGLRRMVDELFAKGMQED